MTKVLVVDDDKYVRQFMSKWLEIIFKFEVLNAQNGEEALKVLREENPVLVFLDITMPVMDGISFLKAVRADANLKQTEVIIITAANERTIINEFLQLGILDYLIKPFEFEETKARLKKSIYPVLREIERKKNQDQSNS